MKKELTYKQVAINNMIILIISLFLLLLNHIFTTGFIHIFYTFIIVILSYIYVNNTFTDRKLIGYDINSKINELPKIFKYDDWGDEINTNATYVNFNLLILINIIFFLLHLGLVKEPTYNSVKLFNVFDLFIFSLYFIILIKHLIKIRMNFDIKAANYKMIILIYLITIISMYVMYHITNELLYSIIISLIFSVIMVILTNIREYVYLMLFIFILHLVNMYLSITLYGVEFIVFAALILVSLNVSKNINKE